MLLRRYLVPRKAGLSKLSLEWKEAPLPFPTILPSPQSMWEGRKGEGETGKRSSGEMKYQYLH